MGVEGAPEGPEDPIAQICITVGKVRRLIQKNTRIDFKRRREVFFFFSLFLSLSLSKSSTAAKDKNKISSCSYSSSSSLLQSKESRVILLLLTVFLSSYIYNIYIHTHTCTHTRTGSRLGNVRRRDEGCVQSCEMARLLQVRGVQRDEV